MKQYQAYSVRIINNNLVGCGFGNFKNEKQAINSAKTRFKDLDVVEVLVYDTYLDIPVLFPVFRLRKAELMSKDIIKKMSEFWNEKLESIEV